MPFRQRAGLAACLAALGQLLHGHLGLLVRDVDVNFERLLVDVADPAAECEETHPAKNGDRAEGVPELVVGSLEAELREHGLEVGKAMAVVGRQVGRGSGASAGTPVLAANTSGALVKTGSNQLTLSTGSTYSGGTRIATGTLRYSNASALGTDNLTLSGSSSYSGATSVATGRLSVNGILGDTPVAVLAAAELGGSGSIAGPVSIAAGGSLAPGNSIASFASGTASFAAGATFAYEVDSTNPLSLGAAADLLVVSGNLNLDLGNASLLTLADIASSVSPFVEDTTIFAMINYSGA